MSKLRALAGVLVAVAAGCGSDDPDAAATGGTPGTGGEPGRGGTAGAGGTSGSAGKSGSGGASGGEAGSGGTSGSGGLGLGGIIGAGTGGTSGAGGSSGGSGGAGTGGTAGGELCFDLDACESCEAAATGDFAEFCAFYTCSALAGNAEGGASAGTPRASLCEDLLECYRRTQCFSLTGGEPGGVDATACWCSDPDIGACAANTGFATGPCAAEVEAAAESDTGETVTSNFKDDRFATGVAFNRLEACDFFNCRESCFCPAD